MEHVLAAWVPVSREVTNDAVEDVAACCAFLDAVQQGYAVLPAVQRSGALALQGHAFRLAIWNDHVPTVQALLQMYGRHWSHATESDMPQGCSGSLLALAASYGATATAIALVQANASLETASSFKTPLAEAVYKEHAGTASALLKLKAQPDAHVGHGSLQVAAEEGHVALVALLLEAKAAVNWCDSFGTTALCQAAEAGHAAVLALLLLEDGIAVDLADRRGVTPLFDAASSGDAHIVAMLVQANAAVNLADRNGITPLHRAVESCDVSTVTFLLEAKAAVDARNRFGRTPLHRAVEWCQFPIVTILLQAKAAIDAPGNGGWKFLSMCGRRRRLDMLQLLKAEAAARAGAHAEAEGRRM